MDEPQVPNPNRWVCRRNREPVDPATRAHLDAIFDENIRRRGPIEWGADGNLPDAPTGRPHLSVVSDPPAPIPGVW